VAAIAVPASAAAAAPMAIAGSFLTNIPPALAMTEEENLFRDPERQIAAAPF
jgi:hypothetical protein